MGFDAPSVDEGTGDSQTVFVGAIGIPIEVDIGGPIVLRFPLPFTPIIPGMVADIGFYSLIGAVTLRLLRSIRVRALVKQDRCAGCGYDLHGRDSCPECGGLRYILR